MSKSMSQYSLGGLLMATVAVWPATCFAENHVIEGVNFKWISGTNESTPGTALVVEVMHGDTIDVVVNGGSHGFVTINKEEETEERKYVIACGEDANKEGAVLRELCSDDSASQFGKNFIGTMRLEVLNAFSAETNFWCTQHFSDMPGVIKLKSGTGN